MRRKFNYLLSCLMSVLLIFSMVTPKVFANDGQASGEDVTGKFPFITSVQLTKNGVDLKDGLMVQKNDKVKVRYEYRIPDDVDNYVNGNEGDYIFLELPKEFQQLISIDPIDLKFKDDEGNDASAGTVTLENGKIKVTFTKDAYELSDVAGYFDIDATFDAAKIGDESPVKIEFKVGSSVVKEINVNFEQKPKEDATLAKTGTYNPKTNEITWTVKLNSNKQNVKNGIFKDVLSDNHDFVSNSLKLNGVEVSSDKYSIVGRALTYTFPEAFETEQVFTYITKPNILPGDGVNFDYSNKVDVTYGNNTTVTVTEKTPYKADLLQKTGTYDSGSKSIKWTVTVNKDSQTLSDVKVEDVIQNGLELDVDSISISNNGLLKGTLNKSVRGFDFTFTNEINSPYTITYSTKIIDPTFFENVDSKEFTNQVNLIGKDIFGSNVTANENIGVNATPNRITKDGVSYNPSTREITWKIIVNSNEITIKNAKVTDKILSGQEFVEGSFQYIGNVTPTHEFTNGSLIVTYPGQIDKKQEIIFKTKVTSNYDYATNKTSNYKNDAILSGDNIKTTSATGDQTVESQVLNKAVAEKYNYETRKIKWAITVNKNGLPLNNVIVTDVIPAGQSYVAGSAKIDGNNPTGEEFVHENGLLTYKLQSISQMKTLTYETEVTDPDTFFKDNGDKKISNTAAITADDIPGQVTHTANETIRNDLVTKKGSQFNETEQNIEWQVDINPNHIKLPTSNAIISDTLQDGLELDTQSVKLYKLEVDKSGTLTKGEEVPFGDENVKYDITTNKFDFILPTEINEAYRLVFKTDVTKNGTYKNTVTFNGSGSSLASKEESIVVSKYDASGAGSGTSGSIKVIKVDEKDGTVKLQGAVFELLDSAKRVIKISDATTKDGEVLFKRLKLNRDYFVREKTPPTGYELSPEEYKFNLVNEDGKKNIEYIYKNKHLPGTIEFLKVGEDKKPLEGAVFKLYAKTDMAFSNPIATVTSDKDGLVKFTDIELGEYVIKESSAPTGYYTYSKEITANVTKHTEEGVTQASPYEVVNEKIPYVPGPNKGTVQLKKVDQASQSLAGASFGIYKSDDIEFKNPVATQISGSDGIVNFANIENGMYNVVETAAPTGYVKSDEVIKVNVNGNEGQLYQVGDVKNRKIEATITIKKTDGAGNLLAGAAFTLYDSDGKEVATATSDKDGFATFKKVPFGSYTIKETKAPKGYVINKKVVKVTVKDASTQEFTFVNKKKELTSDTNEGNKGDNAGSNPGSNQSNNDNGTSNKGENASSNIPGGNTGTLPDTGTEYYNYILLGGLIGILGAVLIGVDRLRNRRLKESK